MRIWRDNPLARYLIDDPEPNLARRLIGLALLSATVILGLAIVFYTIGWPGLSLTVSCPLWIAALLFPGMIAARASRIAKRHIGSDQYNIVRMTDVSPAQIIVGFGLAGLYRARKLSVMLYAALPGMLLATYHVFLWYSSGPGVDPMIALGALTHFSLLWLRPIIFATGFLSTITLAAVTIILQMWGMMSKARAEYKPIAADLVVALAIWIFSIGQFFLPVLALQRFRRDGVLVALTLVAVCLPVAHGLLSVWMLRMADRRL